MNPQPSASAWASRGRPARAFTLTEILIAIALIVAMVAIAVANYNGIFEGGRINLTKTFVTEGMQAPLMNYKLTTGTFPKTDEGLRALIVAPAGRSGWSGPYLSVKNVPVDPWGNEYHYAAPGKHNPDSYDLWSLGPDGQDGTTDDIGNW